MLLNSRDPAKNFAELTLDSAKSNINKCKVESKMVVARLVVE